MIVIIWIVYKRDEQIHRFPAATPEQAEQFMKDMKQLGWTVLNTEHEYYK